VLPHNAEKTPHGQSDLQLLLQGPGKSSSRASDGVEMGRNNICRAEEMNDGDQTRRKEGATLTPLSAIHVMHVKSEHTITKVCRNTKLYRPPFM
jgi:hypothetical protein